MSFEHLHKHSRISSIVLLFKKWANPGPFFCLFTSFQHVTILIDKSVGGVLGIRTRGGRMEDTDEYFELRRHPLLFYCYYSPGICVYFRVYTSHFNPNKVSFSWSSSILPKKLKYNKNFHISFNQSIDSGNANWRDGSARTRNSKPPIWSVVIAHLQQQQHHLHQQQNHHRQQQLQHRHWRQHKDTHVHANLPLGACYVTNSRYSGKRFHDPYLVNANLQPKLKGTPSHSKKLQFASKIVELTVGKLRLMTGQEN